MEQRRLRLGDILDDYCPRERRVTNHAVVAMIEEDSQADPLHDVRRRARLQGRQGAAPAQEGNTVALYKEVLAGKPAAIDDAPHLTPAAPAVTPMPTKP